MERPDIVLLRPQPGAARSAATARSMGLNALIAPIFGIVPIRWSPPSAKDHDAIVFTSAAAPHQAGSALAAYTHLPCYAVGDATAEAARLAGFSLIREGSSDAAALALMINADGVARPLHLCGQDSVGLPLGNVVQRIVYSAEALSTLESDAAEALREGAIALLHSPRAGRHFASLAEQTGLSRSRIRIAAISDAAAAAVGPGWREVAVAAAPRDPVLLELARSMCNKREPS